jgi:histidine triad (HIT) family protein
VSAAGDCLFCKILAGEIPSDVVLETEHTYAFRDIEPTAPTHVLVIPREHIDSAAAITVDHAPIVEELLVTAQQVARQEGVADSGYRLVFNVGDDALNTVPHLHLHVIGGRKLGWPPG